MAASNQDDEGVISGINVTPLVDICLVLLIIMMVTARIIANLQISLDLPKAKMGADQQVLFGVDLQSNGDTIVDGEKLDDPSKMKDMAKDAFSKNPELRATIRAETTVTHGRVMEAVDYLKEAGITKIAFGTSRKAEETPSGN